MRARKIITETITFNWPRVKEENYLTNWDLEILSKYIFEYAKNPQLYILLFLLLSGSTEGEIYGFLEKSKKSCTSPSVKTGGDFIFYITIMLVWSWGNSPTISTKFTLPLEEVRDWRDLLNELSRVIPKEWVMGNLWLAKRSYIRTNWKRSDFVSCYNELVRVILSEGVLSPRNRELIEVISLEMRELNTRMPYLKIKEIPLWWVSHNVWVTNIIEGRTVYHGWIRNLSRWK